MKTQGIIAKNIRNGAAVMAIQTNVISIFINIWPDIIFANNLKAKLINLVVYDTTSIVISNLSIAGGVP